MKLNWRMDWEKNTQMSRLQHTDKYLKINRTKTKKHYTHSHPHIIFTKILILKSICINLYNTFVCPWFYLLLWYTVDFSLSPRVISILYGCHEIGIPLALLLFFAFLLHHATLSVPDYSRIIFAFRHAFVIAVWKPHDPKVFE